MGETGPIDGYRFDGKTDPQIVIELMLAAGNPNAESESHIAAVCRRYLDVLEVQLRNREHQIDILPGVETLLDELESRPDNVVGLLTGNLARGAVLKLTAAGLDPQRFRVGAYGSDSAIRADLPAIAAARAESVMGHVPVGQSVIIIGDTPADMTCGQGVGARAVGVATGRHDVTELLDAGAHSAFDDLSVTDDVLTAICS
jgi:phosphoglycolate phosphatase-like HAD superfamily hydrolase